MITTIDTETQGLDARKFLMGGLKKETGKYIDFMKKNEIWKYIIELGKSEQRRGKVLYVYAHNMSYDWHAIADFKQRGMSIKSNRPFITTISNKVKINEDAKEVDREFIVFLDLMSFMKMSLKKVGEYLGYPKLEIPEKFIKGQFDMNNKKDVDEAKIYLKRDTEIVMKAIQWIKDKLKEDGVKIRRLYTVSQMAINYVMYVLRQDERELDFLFLNKNKNYTYKPAKFFDENGEIEEDRAQWIHLAYRGGPVRVWSTGYHEKAFSKDVNSLYPKVMSEMRMPDLRTEKKIRNPLKYENQNKLLNRLGISKAMIYNDKDKYRIMPIRTIGSSFHPGKGKYMIGIWTNTELKHAIENGYKLIDIEFSIVYDDAPFNPFKEVMTRLYEKKQMSKNKMEEYFYKQIMNRSIGKFGQRKVEMEMVIDSVELAREYIANNYKIVKGLELDYLYKKTDTDGKPKPYYSPIIPCLVNAEARIYMSKLFRKVDLNNLIYSDTDSIWTRKPIKIDSIDEKELGGLKDEVKGLPVWIYSKKTYIKGKEAMIAGVRKHKLSEEELRTHVIKSKSMKSIKSVKSYTDAGRFVTESRDLRQSLREFREVNKLLEDRKIYIDNGVNNIQFFSKYLKAIAY